MGGRPSWRDYAGLRRRVTRLEREHELGDTSWHGAVAFAAAVGSRQSVGGAGEDARAPGAGGTPAVRRRLVLPDRISVPADGLERVLDQVDRARLDVQDAVGGALIDRLRRLRLAEGLLDEATDALIAWLDGAMAPFGVCVDWGRDEGTCYSEITATDDRSHPAPVTAPDLTAGRAPEPGFVACGSGAPFRRRRAQPALLALALLGLAVVAVGLAVLEVVG